MGALFCLVRYFLLAFNAVNPCHVLDSSLKSRLGIEMAPARFGIEPLRVVARLVNLDPPPRFVGQQF